MKFGRRKLNMATRRGILQAIADANIKVPRAYAVLTGDMADKLYFDVMGVDYDYSVENAANYNQLAVAFEYAYDLRRDKIENCVHDFGDRSRHWGIDDHANCNHCGVAVSSGGLLEIPGE